MAGRNPRVSKDPQVRREELLAAAFKLFQETGYENTSVQMITDSVGTSKGLFYHYFDSKTTLLNDLVAWQAALFVKGLPRAAADMEGGSLDKLRQIIARATRWKLDDLRTISRAYLDVMYREESRGLRTAIISTYLRELAPLFGEIIAGARDEGICQVDDPGLAAELCLALGAGLHDRFAELIVGLADPQNVARLVALTHGLEQSMERILGMQPGILQLYDAEAMADDLVRLMAEDSGQKGSG